MCPAMTGHKVEGAEELKSLRIKHAKTIERSARVLVELEESTTKEETEVAKERATVLAAILPDPDVKPPH